MPKTVSFSLKTANLRPDSSRSALPWQIAAVVLALVAAGQWYYYHNKLKDQPLNPSYSVPALGRDTEVAAITHKASDFVARCLSFSVTQLDDHKKQMIEMMTLDYANAYQIVWQDPTLTSALKTRQVEVSVAMSEPALKEVDQEGRFFVNVSGKVIVKSALTYIRSQERYFAGTVVLIKTQEGLKVANVIWRNASNN